MILDIKTAGLVPDIADAVREERMWDNVRWPPDSDEVKRLVPNADIGGSESWVQLGVSTAEVKRLHSAHKRVIVNFLGQWTRSGPFGDESCGECRGRWY